MIGRDKAQTSQDAQNYPRTQLEPQTSSPGSSSAHNDSTTIRIDHEQDPLSSPEHSTNSIRISMDDRLDSSSGTHGEALQRPEEPSDGAPSENTTEEPADEDALLNTRAYNQIRAWRTNMNNVFSFASGPSTETIRSMITQSGSFRYTPLNANNNGANNAASAGGGGDPVNLRFFHDQNSQRPINNNYAWRNIAHNHSAAQRAPQEAGGSQPPSPARPLPNDHPPVNGAGVNPVERARDARQQRNLLFQQLEEDNNEISDLLIKLLNHFIRYLPMIGIVFLKCMYDHMSGIWEIIALHGCLFYANRSLRHQIANFSSKSYRVLIRDLFWITCVVSSRFMNAPSSPVPYGLLLAPATESVTMAVASLSKAGATVGGRTAVRNFLSKNLEQLGSTTETMDSIYDTDSVTIPKPISLGTLLHSVARNDVILKLLTILIKLTITMLPRCVIRHKSRARLFVCMEYLSQFYRAFAPMHQWLLFLTACYSGISMVTGVVLSALYIGAKYFEFVDRGRLLKNALVNFVRNLDFERKPTTDELDAAGNLCPICHDNYKAPVVLECSHIFCDDCVSTWFKREKTCPMCRAKVNKDPTWQDGATTFFYQLC